MNDTRLHDLIERLSALQRSEVRGSSNVDGKRLQPVHVAVLAYLSSCNRFSDTPQAVTEFLGLTKGTVSQSIRSLERGGYVDKSSDKNDGRVVHLSLTSVGEAALAKIYPSALLGQVQNALSAEEHDTLLGLLERLLLQALALNEQKPFGICSQCRFFRRQDGGPYCGLVDVPLLESEIGERCRDFEQAILT